MGLIANDKTVYDLLNDKMYHVPDNQRKYVWNENNWKELFEDIDLVRKDQISDHFIGSIVLKNEGAKDGVQFHYNIIDGQQRISTITILICAIGLLYAKLGSMAKFNGLKKSLFVSDTEGNDHTIIADDANKDIAKLVKALYLITNKTYNAEHRVITVDELFEEIKISKNIADCFKFFYFSLNDAILGDINQLEKFRVIVQDIRYIDIVAEDDEDAYTIFEILNARGQALIDFDLLRNFLLKYASIEDKDEIKRGIAGIEKLLGEHTEIFLKHYVIHKYGVKSDKKQKRPYKIIVDNEKTSNKLELLNDLVLKAKFYDKIINYTNCSHFEYKVFSYFKPRRQQQFRPLVLGLMHQKDLGVISEEIYNTVLDYLYSFFICFSVIGDQTSNKIEDIVYTYSDKLENCYSDEVVNKMKEAMCKKMPLKDNFILNIKRICYSNHINAYSGSRKHENAMAVLELLERIEDYDGDFNNATIEHCNPDSEAEINSLIGNLILLEKPLNNDECHNKPLKDKIEIYKKSRFKMPCLIYNEFKQHEMLDIDKRTQFIAEKLYNYIYRLSGLSR